MSFRISLAFTLCLLIFSNLWAWGEKGHHIICHTGGKLIEQKYEKSIGVEKSLSKLMGRYKLALGHACNIPDNYWRAENLPYIVEELNGPTHFFNPEHFVGLKPKMGTIQDEIRRLPTLYEQLLLKFNGKNSLLTGKPFNIFKAGSAPWRTDELYLMAIRAFKCFGGKLWQTADLKYKMKSSLREFPEADFFTINDLTDPYFVCDRKRNRFSDLSAAVAMLGIMGHFVGDMTQPYHATADYDGWATGQGGIHSYFETDLVESLEGLEEEVFERAKDLEFQKVQKAEVGWPTNFAGINTAVVAYGMLKLAANSNLLKTKLAEIDRTVSVVKVGTILPMETTRKDKKEQAFEAQRRSPNFPAVQKAFRQMIVDRLALGAVLYSDLVVQAWINGGKPLVELVYPNNSKKWVQLLYPLAPPFAVPQYDKGALEAVLKAR